MMVTPGPKVKRNQTIERAQGIFNPMYKRLYTIKEAAQYLGISEWSMRELIWGGKIPYVRRDGGRKIYVDIEDLSNFIKQNKSICL